MFLYFLYVILVIYVGVRFKYLVEYLIINRDMVIDIEKRKIDSDNGMKFNYPLPDKSYINKWKKLYSKDDFFEKLGSAILAMIPLAYFMYNSITGENPLTLIIYVIYPFLLQIVNIIFGYIGIDNNLYISDMYKERFLARRYKIKIKKIKQ